MPHQVSLVVENKPGKIENITRVLAHGKINIRAISISDSGNYGILKLILDSPSKGCKMLNEQGIQATLKDIVVVDGSDDPGSLYSATSFLSKNNINVEDIYAFSLKENNRAVYVFQVDNIQDTETMLKKKGYNVLSERDFTRL